MLTWASEMVRVRIDARVPLGVGGSKEHVHQVPIVARAHLEPMAEIPVARDQNRLPVLPGAHCASDRLSTVH